MGRRFAECDPASLKREERGWQDRQGGALQQRAYARPGTRVVIHGQFARIADALKLRPGLRLLEVGCGVGYLLAWLAKRTQAVYHGIDLSLNSVKSARQTDPTLDLTVGDAEQLPYRDGSFDRIMCNGTAHHLPDLRAAFREIHRVLAPDGILVLYEPMATPVTSALRRLFLRDDAYESPVDLARKEEFTPGRVTALLAEAGFTGVGTSRYDFLAYPLSGNYLGSPLGWSYSLMKFLWHLEGGLARCAYLRPFLDLLAWRMLVVSTKPRAATQIRPHLPGQGLGVAYGSAILGKAASDDQMMAADSTGRLSDACHPRYR